jgi:hypothetical protein
MMREFVGRHTRVVTVAAALLLLAIVWQRTASSEVEVPTAAVIGHRVRAEPRRRFAHHSNCADRDAGEGRRHNR